MKRLLLLPLMLPAAAAAQPGTQQRPLLEMGVFGGAALLPDYPAAGQSHVRGLVLPWVIYRGELLRSDDRGVRGRVYRNRDLELTLNFNGALGIHSRDNRAREGMPNLDYLGEIGPSLRWVAWQDPARRSRVTLEAPLRGVFSTDFSSVRFRGFVVAPEVAYERGDLLRPGARARIGIGPVFASGRLMDYFYRVEGQYARPGRPAYDASGGYLGLRMQFSYRVPVTERLSLTAGGRLENFSGATNAGSPLFKSEFNASLVGGVSFALYRSAAMTASTAEAFD
ncbi:MipA/OmpV family protein [Belnapia sp. T6]|uniref:MipA/OmpV family protein n=1 Tax=Belnapia mucosa TaxID=2804532 RepID=A0ABS1V616_9PROT|nr:MipA/OmpV family protein [Belnapia mucosa]MBL6457047.1 MipA/OmpV family protein [Belnapia mucosa]